MRSVFIATPVYGAPMAHYTAALCAAALHLQERGYGVVAKLLTGLCYVHTARNKLVRDFLVSGLDDLLWWDADIGASPESIVKILEADRDVVGAAAPYRAGKELGFPCNPVGGPDRRPIVDPETGLIQVDPLPTALMKVRREALMKLAFAGKSRLRVEYDREGKERERYLSFFDFEIDEASHTEFGEDVTFGRKWQSLGGTMWVVPDITIQHDATTGNFHDYLRNLPGGGGAAPKDWKFAPRRF